MILVFGKTGQVGQELAAYPGVLCLDRMAADLTHPAICSEVIRDYQPSAVINAAAFTAVDKAENAEAEAILTNGEAPGAMAGACAEISIPLVQISTDYVFDGSGNAPWKTSDRTAPLCAYGRTKLKGEQAVIAQGGSYAILRTSWVVSPHGKNFIKTMLRLGKERDKLTIVADQTGAPTPARDIAAACMTIAEQLIEDRAKTGIYHYTGTPEVSWADFAREIFALTEIDCHVTDILTRDYPTPARRPLNSRLDCRSSEDVFGLVRPDWRPGLLRILRELGEI